MDEQPKDVVDDEREEADAVEEMVEQEPPKADETPAVDAAEELAGREAEDFEEQDTKSGDDPPKI